MTQAWGEVGNLWNTHSVPGTGRDTVSPSGRGAFSFCARMYPKHLQQHLAHGGAESTGTKPMNEDVTQSGLGSVIPPGLHRNRELESHVSSIVGLESGVRADFSHQPTLLLGSG